MALSDAPSPLDSLRSTVHHFGNYRLLEPLNRGASGYVYRIQSLRSQRILALKVLEKKTVTYDRIRSEIEMQTEAQGPGILQLESTFEDA
jgi:serine/threonine protein kinase